MNVALINPEAPINRLDIKGFLGEPIGILYIASMLEHQGHEVKIFDLQMNPNLNLSTEINHYEPNIIGITSMTANFPKAEKVAKLIRQNSSAFIVLGGVHATFTHNELSHHPKFDAYVIGEGEYTMLELANTLESGGELNEVSGLVYKANGKVFYNKPRPLMDNLDIILFPARHLVDMKSYISHKGRVSLITTRGCPYSCIFCSTSKLHGNRYRMRSVENVIKEIDFILNIYAPVRLSFADDNFTFDRLRVKKLCDAIVNHGFDISWSCSARVDNIDEDLLKLMWNSGCEELFFGIESGSQDILNKAKKGFKLKDAEKAVKLAKKYGIKTTASFILGLPGENKMTVQETINIAKKLDADSYIFSFATPFPGTYLHENLKKFEYQIVDYDLSHYTCHYPVMETEEVSSFDLQSTWIEAALQFSKKVMIT